MADSCWNRSPDLERVCLVHVVNGSKLWVWLSFWGKEWHPCE